MNRVCLEKSTGRLIEMQGGGKVDTTDLQNRALMEVLAENKEYASTTEMDEVVTVRYRVLLGEAEDLETMRLNTLLQNAINAGYKEADIEVKWASEEECAFIMEAQRQREEEAAPYTVKRAKAHLPIPDQLDMMYWDKVNGTTNWVDYVTKLKADIPKE